MEQFQLIGYENVLCKMIPKKTKYDRNKMFVIIVGGSIKWLDYSGNITIIGAKSYIQALSCINSVKLEKLLSLSASFLIYLCG